MEPHVGRRKNSQREPCLPERNVTQFWQFVRPLHRRDCSQVSDGSRWVGPLSWAYLWVLFKQEPRIRTSDMDLRSLFILISPYNVPKVGDSPVSSSLLACLIVLVSSGTERSLPGPQRFQLYGNSNNNSPDTLKSRETRAKMVRFSLAGRITGVSIHLPLCCV